MTKTFLASAMLDQVSARDQQLVFLRRQPDARRHDLHRIALRPGIVDVADQAIPDRDQLDVVGAVRADTGGIDGQHVVDQARRLRRGVDRVRSRQRFHRQPRIRLPGADGVDLAGGQHLRRLVGLGIHQLDIVLRHALFLQAIEHQQVIHQADLDADLLALEIGHAPDARPGHDHVVAVGIIGDQDDDVARTARAHDQCIAVGNEVGVDLAGCEGLHRSRIVEPVECDIEAGLLEPAFVDRDLPGHPSGPIAVADAQRQRRGARAAGALQHQKRQDHNQGSSAGHRHFSRAVLLRIRC